MRTTLLLFVTVQKDLFTGGEQKRGYVFIYLNGLLKEVIGVSVERLRGFYKRIESQKQRYNLVIEQRDKELLVKSQDLDFLRYFLSNELRDLCYGTKAYKRVRRLFQ